MRHEKWPRPWREGYGHTIVAANQREVCQIHSGDVRGLIVSCVNAIGDRDPEAVAKLIEWSGREPEGLRGPFTNATFEWCSWFRESRKIVAALRPGEENHD